MDNNQNAGVSWRENVLMLIMRAVPHADQIKDLDMTTRPDYIMFTWRGNRYRVDENRRVGEIQDIGIAGSSVAMLMEALLKYEWLKTL